MSILDVVIPIFGMMFVGWALKHAGILPRRAVDVINNYVYYIGITVITFVSLHDTKPEVLLNPEIYVLSLVPIAITLIIAFAAGRLLKLEKNVFPIFLLCAFFGNTSYIGFPLNVIVLGNESLSIAAFISTIYMVVVFTFGVYLLKRYGEEGEGVTPIYKLPILWAAILGIALSWLPIPGILTLPLNLISQSTSPLALLTTGAMVGAMGQKIDLKNIGVLSAIKLIAMPLTVIFMGLTGAFSGMIYRSAILEAATPIGVTNTVLAVQFRMKYEFVSNAVVLSTIFSAFTLAVLLIYV
jgi:predicted permease